MDVAWARTGNPRGLAMGRLSSLGMLGGFFQLAMFGICVITGEPMKLSWGNVTSPVTGPLEAAAIAPPSGGFAPL